MEEKLLEELLARVGCKAVIVLNGGRARFALLGKLAQSGGRFVARLTAQRHLEVEG